MLRVGCPWRDLPSIYRPWSSVYTRLAALVSVRAVGAVAGSAGTAGPRCVAFSGCQPCQSASGRQQSCWRATKSGHWTHQGRAEHQNQRLGGRTRPSGEFEFGGRPARRCVRGANLSATFVARHDHGSRQRLRQRRVPDVVATVGEPGLHPAAIQPSPTGQMASWVLPAAAHSGKSFPTVETLPENWHSL